jgi:hypothetical protein
LNLARLRLLLGKFHVAELNGNNLGRRRDPRPATGPGHQHDQHCNVNKRRQQRKPPQTVFFLLGGLRDDEGKLLSYPVLCHLPA